MNQDQEPVEQTPEQNAAEFAAGFDSVRNSEGYSPPPEEAAEAPPAEVPAPEEVADDEDEDKGTTGSDEPTYFGLSESQIKALLERSARVDAIEVQLQKAHGKIGELNRTVNDFTAQRPTQPAPVVSASDEEMSQWEQDFPELAAMAEAKARKIATEMMGGQSAQAAEPAISRDEIIREANLAIMDANYDGWRDTIATQDFALWIATQPAEVQDQFNNTISAKVLGGVLSSFDRWKTKANDRGNKSKARLEQALVPSGNASRVTHAPTAHDEFVAGFNAIRAHH